METKKFRFNKEELESMRIKFEVGSNQEALELWAYSEFDLKHNGSLTLGKVGKTSVEIQEIE